MSGDRVLRKAKTNANPQSGRQVQTTLLTPLERGDLADCCYMHDGDIGGSHLRYFHICTTHKYRQGFSISKIFSFLSNRPAPVRMNSTYSCNLWTKAHCTSWSNHNSNTHGPMTQFVKHTFASMCIFMHIMSFLRTRKLVLILTHNHVHVHIVVFVFAMQRSEGYACCPLCLFSLPCLTSFLLSCCMSVSAFRLCLSLSLVVSRNSSVSVVVCLSLSL